MLFKGHCLETDKVYKNQHALRPLFHEIDNPHHSVFPLLCHILPLLKDALSETAFKVTLRERCQILGELQLFILLYH